MKKQGQVTIYVLLGIVIVVSFLLILYLAGSLTSSKLSSEQRKVITGILEASAVNYYAQICLEDALKEGLVLIGRQGGVIYNEQGGLVASSDSLTDGRNKVWLDIRPDDMDLPPAYPCGLNKGQEPDYCRYPQEGQQYSFGKKTFPALTGGAFSIEGQLKLFIQTKVAACVQELMENQTLGFGIQPEGLPLVNSIAFTGTSTVASLDFPLSVKVGQKEPVSTFLHWRKSVPVRMKELYRIIDKTVDNDIHNISFDINKDIEPEGLIFEQRKQGRDEVFVFNDSVSKIDGQNFVFKMARKNRPPALEWINLNYSLWYFYDYLVIEGDLISIAPKAADPDEDELGDFVFSGGLINGQINGKAWQYQTKAGEANYYNLTVSIRDSISDGELADWQVVRVLVDRLLQANFTVRSNYLGFENKISVEDPIYFDAATTTKSLDSKATYFYQWRSQDFDNITETECAVWPGFKNCTATGFEIETIKDQIKLSPGEQYFSLGAVIYYNNQTRFQADQNDKKIMVYECIPYRSNESVYPYNNLDNHFLGNHTCCQEDFTWAPETTECKRWEEKYCQNGKYWKNITARFCSRERGNVCDGEIKSVELVETEESCGWWPW